MGCVVRDNQYSVPSLSPRGFSPRPLFSRGPTKRAFFNTSLSLRDLGLSWLHARNAAGRLDPSQRHPLGEDVEEWEQAAAFARALANMVWDDTQGMFADASRQVLADAQARAEEALRRARERAA
jgi:hypothetical protein